MTRRSFLKDFVPKFFKPEIIEKEEYLDPIFLGLFGMFVSLLFISLFGLIADTTFLMLRMGMFISYSSFFAFILFTLYYSFPLLNYIDKKIGERGVTAIIRGFSLLLIRGLLFFVWPLIASLLSVTQEINILFSQESYLSLTVNFLAVLSLMIPNYVSNIIFDNYNFKLEVEEV